VGVDAEPICYNEHSDGGEHYLEGRHCTVVRSKVADNTRSNTGAVYCTSTNSDNIKITPFTSASSVKGYDYNAVAKGKTDADSEY